MRHLKVLVGAATLALASSPAFAHPGVHHGLAEGFIHPFSGWDHMLAMAALGLWLGGSRSLNAFAAIATAVAALALGFVLGVAGYQVPYIEHGILASVLVFGLLAVSFKRLPAALAAPLIAAFMLCHGHAHGTEVTGDAWLFALGFISASSFIIAGTYLAMRAVMVRRSAHEAR